VFRGRGVTEIASENAWWIAETEGLRGPLTQGEVFDAIRIGAVREGTLVRAGTQGSFATAGEVFPAGFALGEVTQGKPASRETPGQVASSSAEGAIRRLNSLSPETRIFVLLAGAGIAGLVVILIVAVIAAGVSGSGQAPQGEPQRQAEFFPSNPVTPPDPIPQQAPSRIDGGYTGPPPPQSWTGPNMGGYTGPGLPQPWSGP